MLCHPNKRFRGKSWSRSFGFGPAIQSIGVDVLGFIGSLYTFMRWGNRPSCHAIRVAENLLSDLFVGTPRHKGEGDSGVFGKVCVALTHTPLSSSFFALVNAHKK